MLRISCYLSSTLAITFTPLPPWSDYSIGTNAFDYITGIFGRHLAVHPPSGVGRMDCSCSYNPHLGQWYYHMRNAENLGEQESSKEEDS